jgi:uncharacterized zinc-type alcohol dehydrogenase-like protein
MLPSKGYGATSADDALHHLDFQRRDPGPHDVQIQIQYCGVCHSDLHTVRNEWGSGVYTNYVEVDSTF